MTKFAPEVFAIPYEDKFIIYHPLRKLAFLGNQALVSTISKILDDDDQLKGTPRTEVTEFLHQLNFFEPVSGPPLRVNRDAYRPTNVVLLLTNACNLRCTYCYASSGDTGKGVIPVAWAESAIDRGCENAQKRKQDKFSLSFHGGGEPSMAWDRVTRLTEYARSKPVQCQVSITSNGCWSSEKREWLVQHIDSFSISFDGIRKVQDRQRPMASGGSSFAEVIKTIRAIENRNKPYGIRMTVTDETIPSLVESVRFICETTGCKTIQIEPAFKHGRAQLNRQNLKRRDDFTSAFLEAFDIAATHQRRMYYSGARLDVITNQFCSAPMSALILCHDGQLTACYEVWNRDHALAPQMRLGGIDGAGRLTVDDQSRQVLLDKVEQRKMRCRGCFCYYHCAGDCISKTFSVEGDGHLIFGERCELNRKLTKEMLVRLISKTEDGIWQGQFLHRVN